MLTEKEKMISQQNYNPVDATLEKDRQVAQQICFELNHLSPTAIEERRALIHQLTGKVSDNVTLMSGFWCDYGYNLTFGTGFFANFNCVMLDSAPITFGNNVLIGPNCGFYTPMHPFDVEARNSGIEYALPITVGDNVWFGGNVTVLPGVTIGNNNVIAAGSVVTKSIPDNVLAMGNPCKVKKSI